MVYVWDYEAGAVLGFRTTSQGNAAPATMIKGSATTISYSSIFGLAFDGVGSLYTLGDRINQTAFFPTGANGNVAPSGTLTAVYGVYLTGLSFDGNGHEYITTTPSQNPTYSSISIYPTGATGSPSPINDITVDEPNYDSAGNSVVDSNGTLYLINGPQILIYPNALTNNGNQMFMKVLGGANTMLHEPSALAIDSKGDLLVADAGLPGILSFAASAISNIALYETGAGNIAPASMITGTPIGTPSGIAVDASDNMWISDNGSVPQLLEFAAGSSGNNVTPIVRITGSATMLLAPEDIVFVPGGDVTQSAKRRIPGISATRRFR